MIFARSPPGAEDEDLLGKFFESASLLTLLEKRTLAAGFTKSCSPCLDRLASQLMLGFIEQVHRIRPCTS